MQPLFNALDENIVWKSSSPAPYFRFGGVHNKRSGVMELSALLFSTYHFRHFDLKDITAEEDTVWGLFDVEAIHLSTGKALTFEIVVRWVLRDGKVIEHQGFFDTASVLLQQGTLREA